MKRSDALDRLIWGKGGLFDMAVDDNLPLKQNKSHKRIIKDRELRNSNDVGGKHGN